MFLKLLMNISLLLFLTSCKPDNAGIYRQWLQDPNRFKKAYETCQKDRHLTQCEAVLFIAQHFERLVEEEQDTPEKFGMHILKTQSALFAAQNELGKLNMQLHTLEKQPSAAQEINELKLKLLKQNNDYQNLLREYELLMAIAASLRPE